MTDEIEHCAEAARLRARLKEIAEGESIQSDRHDSDEVRYARANIDELRRQLHYHERLCRESQGLRPRRTRFARSGMIKRPY